MSIFDRRTRGGGGAVGPKGSGRKSCLGAGRGEVGAAEKKKSFLGDLISAPFQSRSGVAGGGGGGEQGEAFAAGPEAGAEGVGTGAKAQEAGARLKGERHYIVFPKSFFKKIHYMNKQETSRRGSSSLAPSFPPGLITSPTEVDSGGGGGGGILSPTSRRILETALLPATVGAVVGGGVAAAAILRRS